MSDTGISTEVLPEDRPVSSRTPWLTHRRIVFFVIAWLMGFTIGSVFVANPFASEASAGATPDYWRVMYLHGLLIGMVGLLALVTCQVLGLRSRHVRLWIAAGVIVATVTAAVGGIFDRRIPGAEVAMWTQIVGFFALDEILVVLLVGMIRERRQRTAGALPYVAAWLAAASMLIAALMGHLAGWIMEFGNWPRAIGSFAKSRGMTLGDFTDGLVGSHSHEMAVAVMALVATVAVERFGFRALRGAARAVASTGLGMVAAGVAVMTGVYMAGAFVPWETPTLFQSAGGTNGIAGDDVLTGILVMGGGLLALAPIVVGAAGRLRRTVRLASVWSWFLSFATVVVAGFAIELHETYFGAGDKAPGAAKDAVFTWLHQDIGLFLLPALVLVMLVVDLFVAPRVQGRIALATIAGTSLTFLGAMVFVFVTPALHGPGYALTTAGLAVVGLAIGATAWWGLLGSRRTLPAAIPGPGVPEALAPATEERAA